MGEFGNRLREVRLMRQITQEQLAEKADISRVMIGRYETTDQLPALETLVRIADALGVSTDYLLGRTQAMDAAFEGRYVEPRRPCRLERMPKNTAELAEFVRRIIEQAQSDGDSPGAH